jgi:hypothetical protein
MTLAKPTQAVLLLAAVLTLQLPPAKQAAAQCPCAGVDAVMTVTDLVLNPHMKITPSLNRPGREAQRASFNAALDAASRGDNSQLANWLANPANTSVLQPNEMNMLGIFVEVLNLQQMSRDGTLTAAAFTNLENRISALGPGAEVSGMGPLLRSALAEGKNQQRVCELLCALAEGFGGGPGGGAIPGGGGFPVPSGGGVPASGGVPGMAAPADYAATPGDDAEVVQLVPEAGSQPVAYPGKVLLLNQADSGAAVGYALGHEKGNMLKTYHLPNDDGQAGEHLIGLPRSGKWVIEFDRGDGKIVAYSLFEATYEFAVTEAGLWDLRKRTFKVTVDNSELAGPVPYIVDGKEETVAEGGTNTHSSAWPISIAHDQGDGSTAHLRLKENGNYQWRIQDERLGLYRVVEAQ